MTHSESAEARADPRTNMFLGAIIRGDGLSLPVKVRNMSVTGALVEGGALPEHGAKVQLVRGSLEVAARVAWCSHGRCGLRFSSLVCVRHWLAPQANAAQQRVDETVRVLKLGAVPMPQRPPARPELSPHEPQSVQFGELLRSIMRLIEDLCDDLSSDTEVLIRHGDKLQNIDIAMQTIALAADALGGGVAETVVAPRLGNLQASCTAALERIGAPPSHAP
jgi:hypothetical protein